MKSNPGFRDGHAQWSSLLHLLESWYKAPWRGWKLLQTAHRSSMQLKRPPFVSLCWFLTMMKKSLEVNFRGASMAQSVKENKNEPDSAAWYWKLMYGCFMSSPHEFTTMSAWLYYHLEGKLSQQTNTGRAITTEDHLHSGCDGRERNKKDSPSLYALKCTTFQFSNLTSVGTAITHLKTNLFF